MLTASPLHDHLNKVGAYFIGLGGDGAVKVRLRVNASEPCEPQTDELRKLREATALARLTSESGDMAVLGGGRKSLRFALQPGEWDVAAFGLGMGRQPECLIIVAPTSGSAEPLTGTPELMI